jgi:hypothetical protein
MMPTGTGFQYDHRVVADHLNIAMPCELRDRRSRFSTTDLPQLNALTEVAGFALDF